MACRVLVVVCALVVAGCAGPPPPSAPPEPLQAPELDVETTLPGPPVVAYLTPPPGEPVVDRILASPLMRDPEFQAEVADWIDYWSRSARRWFPDYLYRMGSFEQTVDSALAQRGMPPSLRYLPLIESGYNPRARSHASAVGMWQFMPGTARELGMEVSAFVDERRDPFMSTMAAMGFLEDLHATFDESWFLALAAYNGGPNRARRILREQAPLAQHSDSLFWALREHWPRETREFVPKLVGAIIVAQDPEEYGFGEVERASPFRFDEATVPDAVSVGIVARAAETDEDEIRRLNPELYRGFTPPDRSHVVRVPPGVGDRFADNFAAIPEDERLTIVEHAVAPGETLSHIALRYGISVADLRSANPDVEARYLRVGARLTVPILLARAGSD